MLAAMTTRTTLALALLLAACKSTPAPPGPLQLTMVVPQVGSAVVVTDRLESRMHVTSDPGGVVALNTTRLRTSRVEVLAVRPDGAVTGVDVRYDQHRDLQTRDGVEQIKPGPLEGHRYRVEADGDRLTATRDDGAPVTPAEQAALAADVGRSIGKLPAISSLLLAHAWPIDRPVTLTEAELQASFGRNPMMTPVAGTARMVGLTAGIATFQIDLTLTRDDAQGRAESPLRMTLALDVARFRTTDLTLTGTLTGTVEQMATEGTVEGHVRYAYD